MGLSACFGPGSFNDADVAVGSNIVGGVDQAEYSVDAGPATTLVPADGLPQAVAVGVNNRGDVLGVSMDAAHTVQVPTLWRGAVPPATGPAPAPVNINTLVPAGTTVMTAGTLALIGGNGDIVAQASIDGAAPEYVELQPGGQQISGTLTDPNGQPVPGVQVNVTGTDSQGNAVSQQAFSDIDGNYRVSLDPGNYAVSPVQPSDVTQGRYVPSGCSGTIQTPACVITLNSGDQATASFKLVKFVVNSTLDGEDTAEAALGVCDVTPSQASQTCTLRQAIDVANTLGGGSITFDIPGSGVPLIHVQGAGFDLTAPVVIDGTTQPGSNDVSVVGGGAGLGSGGFEFASRGGTLRGMTVYGFSEFDVALDADGDTLEQDRLGTIASSVNPFDAVVYEEEGHAGGQNVIQGNVVGGPPALDGRSYFTLDLSNANDTVGGSLPGQGNTITGGEAEILGAGDVIRGNKFVGGGGTSALTVHDHETVGGPTATPGTGAGNEISESLYGLLMRLGDVVQGNHVHDNVHAGIGLLAGNTIGGASPQMGNLVDNNGNTVQTMYIDDGGIAIGQPATPVVPATGGSGNVIENNQILNNVGDGGVAVYDGTGNHVFKNTLVANTVAINLGGGPYRYNPLGFTSAGPNHFQPYPELLDVGRGSRSRISAQLRVGLSHAQTVYTVDVYAQVGSCQDSVTGGEAAAWLTSAQVRTDGIGTADLTLTLPHAAGAVTLTATAPDGSTSELSPCLSVGHKAASFTGKGVGVPGGTVTATSPPAAGSAADIPTATTTDANHGAAAKSKKHALRLTATVRPFCPPVTTGYCAGTIVIRQASNHRTIARLKFKLAPGQLGTLTFKLSNALTKLLEHAHRIRLTSTIAAHDHARRAHHKTTTKRLALKLAQAG